MNGSIKFVLAIALTFLAVIPAYAAQDSKSKQFCLNQADATEISGRFGDILSKRDSDIGNYSQTAEAIIGKHYYAISDSNLSLQNLTVRAFHPQSVLEGQQVIFTTIS